MSKISAAVKQAYNVWVDQYDTNANQTRDLNAQVLRQQSFGLAGKRILEIGCGTGLNTVWLAEHAQAVVAADLTEGMLHKAQQRVGDAPVSFVQMDITRPWPFQAQFDLIVANLVLEHVRDLAHVFAEARRVLRPRGRFYISELHPYKQLQGVQARYADPESGADVLVPAFLHLTSEYINGALTAGFTLRHIGEWQTETDTVLRLLTLLLERG